MRGHAGQTLVNAAAARHSPWAADAASMLTRETGFVGKFPVQSGCFGEILVCAGRVTIDASDWYRGCYSLGGPKWQCGDNGDWVTYVRLLAC
jgi:hypothetical protein